jgi:hypothetical protein
MWESNNNCYGKYINDPSRSSFLLQLELREKMTLIQGKELKAIYDDFGYGPAFGSGNDSDLCIRDKCNQNSNSSADMPDSYNCGSKYQRNQQTWTLFSGATNGYKFRVIEYEVFEVLK